MNMGDTSFLDWPFFEDRHRDLARGLDAWATKNIPHKHGPDVDAECRALVKSLGAAGWLNHAVPAVRPEPVEGSFDGAQDRLRQAEPERGAIDTRAICLIRETLARHSGLADFAFAMQGLGSGAISLDGSAEQKERYLPRVSRGEAI